MVEKFDFTDYEKRVNEDPLNGRFYIKSDSTIVEEIIGEKPVRWEIPPKPSFVKIYKEFYPNGSIKRKETYIGKYTKVDTSLYYDEKGDITKKIDENSKFGKIKPENILKFLEEKKLIKIETGEGREDNNGNQTFEIVYNMDKNIWFVTILEGRPYTALEISEMMKNSKGEPNDWKPFEYIINGETGEVISSNE